jgi:putative oxidoreductase
MNRLKPYTEETYAMMRIVAGFLFSFHGVQKIFHVLTPHATEFGSQIWFGGMIEMLGGVAILLGWQTRAAAFLCSGTMAVAYFQFHWKFQGGSMILPAINEGEMAALYCFVFLFLACRGNGKWSLGGAN